MPEATPDGCPARAAPIPPEAFRGVGPRQLDTLSMGHRDLGAAIDTRGTGRYGPVRDAPRFGISRYLLKSTPWL